MSSHLGVRRRKSPKGLAPGRTVESSNSPEASNAYAAPLCARQSANVCNSSERCASPLSDLPGKTAEFCMPVKASFKGYFSVHTGCLKNKVNEKKQLADRPFFALRNAPALFCIAAKGNRANLHSYWSRWHRVTWHNACLMSYKLWAIIARQHDQKAHNGRVTNHQSSNSGGNRRAVHSPVRPRIRCW